MLSGQRTRDLTNSKVDYIFADVGVIMGVSTVLKCGKIRGQHIILVMSLQHLPIPAYIMVSQVKSLLIKLLVLSISVLTHISFKAVDCSWSHVWTLWLQKQSYILLLGFVLIQSLSKESYNRL